MINKILQGFHFYSRLTHSVAGINANDAEKRRTNRSGYPENFSGDFSELKKPRSVKTGSWNGQLKLWINRSKQ